MCQTADNSDYSREADSLNSVCDWASGTTIDVNRDGCCGKTETIKNVVKEQWMQKKCA